MHVIGYVLVLHTKCQVGGGLGFRVYFLLNQSQSIIDLHLFYFQIKCVLLNMGLLNSAFDWLNSNKTMTTRKFGSNINMFKEFCSSNANV